MYRLSVPVAYKPMSFFAPDAELEPELADLLEDDDDLLWARMPRMTPTTAAAMTRMATGIPIFTHLLVAFFALEGVMKPVDSL